eukprot:COSAG02_NODE_49552_length_326_cov_0.682819_1_plen_79_part_01
MACAAPPQPAPRRHVRRVSLFNEFVRVPSFCRQLPHDSTMVRTLHPNSVYHTIYTTGGATLYTNPPAAAIRALPRCVSP